MARQAMATRFEVALHGADVVALRAAAEEAFDEIVRIEAMLSLYRPGSEIARLNALAHREAVRVSPTVFRLLEQSRRLWEETGGAFDITLLPLLRCWGLAGGRGRIPSQAELEEVRACVGTDKLELDTGACTVRFGQPGMMLDLGAIGKGYAVDQAVGLLREAGVEHGLIHGGTSSVYGMGHPPGQEAWRVALEIPIALLENGSPDGTSFDKGIGQGDEKADTSLGRLLVAVVELRDMSLSVSAGWGKSFRMQGRTHGHVLDPGTGTPAERAWMAAVVLPSATEGDALSTALLVRGATCQETMAQRRPGMRSFVATATESGIHLSGLGLPSLHGPRLPWTKLPS
jgi:FAD:protein FMN transferase